ncbi:HpcH/HpaI aldolase/citrate lyase family protein [Mycobacterium sp. NPDC003449]
MDRSYLFVPGHRKTLMEKALRAGADAVIVDLEDAVPGPQKPVARALAAQMCAGAPLWVRINAVGTEDWVADLDAVAGLAVGIRIPKVETPEQVEAVAQRCPDTPLICAIETARGLLAAVEIAAVPQCGHLAMGGLDLRHDLGTGPGAEPMLYARSHLVAAARAAGIGAPIDSVFADLDDAEGLRNAALHAKSLGFSGKSAISPRQLDIIHEVFSPSPGEVEWARRVMDAFTDRGGEASRLETGEFIDVPVAKRAAGILTRAADISRRAK